MGFAERVIRAVGRKTDQDTANAETKKEEAELESAAFLPDSDEGGKVTIQAASPQSDDVQKQKTKKKHKKPKTEEPKEPEEVKIDIEVVEAPSENPVEALSAGKETENAPEEGPDRPGIFLMLRGRGRRPRPRKPGNETGPHQAPEPQVHVAHESQLVGYSTGKNISNGVLNLALLTSNASQLKNVLRREDEWDLQHKINTSLITISIIFQIISGVIIVLIGREDAQDRKAGQQKPHTLNNLVMILAFLITVTNIFVASFGGDDI